MLRYGIGQLGWSKSGRCCKLVIVGVAELGRRGSSAPSEMWSARFFDFGNRGWWCAVHRSFKTYNITICIDRDRGDGQKLKGRRCILLAVELVNNRLGLSKVCSCCCFSKLRFTEFDGRLLLKLGDGVSLGHQNCVGGCQVGER